MIAFLAEMFSYPFMVRAFVVGTLIAVCSSVLGVSLVLKRFSMIGDCLSHVGFGTLAVANIMHVSPLPVSIPVVIGAAFLLLRITNSRIKGDAAIALISTAALAMGVMVISMTTGMNTDVCNYMFGSILSMTRGDVVLSVIIAVGVLVLYIIFYNRIFAVTFDESFARATGTDAGLYTMLLALLTALVIVVGMRMMGALLISSMIVLPSLSAMRLCKTFKKVIIVSMLISVACLWAGLLVSYCIATPTGASIVICNLAVFIVCAVFSAMKRRRRIRALAGLQVLLCLSLMSCVKAKKGFSARLPTSEESAAKQRQQEEQLAQNGGTNAYKDEAFLDELAKLESGELETLPPVTYEEKPYEPLPVPEGDVLEIKEKMFLTQINDIYYNFDGYKDKTIVVEGMYTEMISLMDTDVTCPAVYRRGPGCCGNDGWGGFILRYNGAKPKLDDWIRVTGHPIMEKTADGYEDLYLVVDSLEIKQERGAEFVTQ